MSDSRSLTSRRSYVAGLAGSVFGLAGVWSGLGMIAGDDGHGHGHGGEGSLTPQEFEAYLDRYRRRYGRPDGTVVPPSEPADHDHGEGSDDHAHRVPVYLRAVRWAFRPRRYRLRTGVEYDLRMMSMDVTHGAAIHLGSGSVVHRLPPKRPVRDAIAFEEPGEYPVYCSFYCGRAHNRMSATLVVE